jgi:nucleoside phosphorylase
MMASMDIAAAISSLDTHMSNPGLHYRPPATSPVSDLSFDVGVIIALQEEFDIFIKAIQHLNRVELWTSFTHDDVVFWRICLHLSSSRHVQVVAVRIGEMGTEYAAVHTSIMISKWRVPFIVNIGLTGTFDSKDLPVGSILVPSQVTHYTANAKAKDQESASSGFELLMGTRAFATNRSMLQLIENFMSCIEYENWSQVCHDQANHLMKPVIRTGHLASGNVVIDSEHYVKELKRIDRKLLGCEMEAAGIFIAEHCWSNITSLSTQILSLRCISDECFKKATSDSGQEGRPSNRLVAMNNATRLLWYMLEHRVLNTDFDDLIAKNKQHNDQLKKRSDEAKFRLVSSSLTREELVVALKNQNLSASDLNKLISCMPPDKVELICGSEAPTKKREIVVAVRKAIGRDVGGAAGEASAAGSKKRKLSMALTSSELDDGDSDEKLLEDLESLKQRFVTFFGSKLSHCALEEAFDNIADMVSEQESA